MEKRPLSLTIIGWLLVLSGVFGLYSVLTMGSNPQAMEMMQAMGVSPTYQRIMGILGCVVSLICAYGVFKGLPWSRVLYVVWSVISLAINLAVMPMMSVIILGLIFLAIIGFFLFRPAADQWFAAKGFQLHRNAA